MPPAKLGYVRKLPLRVRPVSLRLWRDYPETSLIRVYAGAITGRGGE